jgi:hypothetical protein
VCFQGIESSGDEPIEAANFHSFPVGIAETLREGEVERSDRAGISLRFTMKYAFVAS